jgi:hypothetical protein
MEIKAHQIGNTKIAEVISDVISLIRLRMGWISWEIFIIKVMTE